MTDATLIADLVRAGVDADLVGRVASAIVGRQSADSSADSSADDRRRRDREYQKAKRLRDKTEKQTMLGSVASSADASADSGGRRCDLTSFLSSTSEEQRRKKARKEEQASARGTRMFAGAELSPAAWKFARDEGFQDTQIAAMWREFVDFWVGVPGQRGLKRDWLATWRNRVRDVKARQGTSNGGHKNGSGNGVMDAFDRLIDRAARGEVGDDSEMVDVTPRGS